MLGIALLQPTEQGVGELQAERVTQKNDGLRNPLRRLFLLFGLGVVCQHAGADDRHEDENMYPDVAFHIVES